MSQNTETPLPISEDLFTTEDLIRESPATENFTDEVQNVEMSEDLDFGSNTEHGDDPEHLHESEDLPETEEQELGDKQMGDEEEANEEELDVMQDDTEESENNPDEANTETSADGGKSKAAKKPSTQKRISELPLSKVKHIIKLDPEVQLVNAEAVYLVTRATELFVKSLAKESFTFAVQMKKKTITKSHVDQALAMLPIEL